MREIARAVPGAGPAPGAAVLLAIAACLAVAGCSAADRADDASPEENVAVVAPEAELRPELQPLADRIEARMTATGGRYAVAWRDLGTGDEILLNVDSSFHAASMMKVPVMVRLFRMAEADRIDLDRPIPVRNEFRSIEDGSLYALSPDDDSDSTLYARVGGEATPRELIERMIARSSNLATNILVELADPDSIATMLGSLDADGMKVLRGVEDIPAYRAGRNNTTTARGLLALFTALAEGRAAGPDATAEMLAILQRQEFNDAIPAGLPPGTPVAHKTGWIPAVDHDGGIVFPAEGAPWVLVILTSGVEDETVTRAAAAHVSRTIWDWKVWQRSAHEETGGRATESGQPGAGGSSEPART